MVVKPIPKQIRVDATPGLYNDIDNLKKELGISHTKDLLRFLVSQDKGIRGFIQEFRTEWDINAISVDQAIRLDKLVLSDKKIIRWIGKALMGGAVLSGASKEERESYITFMNSGMSNEQILAGMKAVEKHLKMEQE